MHNLSKFHGNRNSESARTGCLNISTGLGIPKVGSVSFRPVLWVRPGALEAYEADLKKHPNRFNGLYGAGLASEKINNVEKAKYYYQELTDIANSPTANRPELDFAKLFLKKEK